MKLFHKLLLVLVATMLPAAVLLALPGEAEVLVAGGLILGLVLGITKTWFVVRGQKKKIEAVKTGAEAVSTGDLRHMIRTSSKDEMGDLIDVFNRMTGDLLEERRRQEVESWKKLVRVLGHEINNTLAPIGSLADTMRTSLVPRVEDERVRRDLEESAHVIQERSEHLRRFVERYSLIAKLPKPQRVRRNLDDVVRNATGLLKADFAAKKVRLLQDYNARGAEADIDESQFSQVIINLLKNASEACTGVVGVETHRNGSELELRVFDDGPGFTSEALEKVFTPFFSTKPGGSGIGLALSRQIARAHGGDIVIESGQSGTTARVLMPAAR